uniref:Uncharacterized protein n=1 Tax=Arundo donax TaxID=35708 RepID=A0A0A9SCI5_ARUDO
MHRCDRWNSCECHRRSMFNM